MDKPNRIRSYTSNENLPKAVRTKMAQKIAAAGIFVGMSVSLVGCGANDDQPLVPTNAPVSYGMAIGSGEKVDTATGTYEKITLSPGSPAYKYHPLPTDKAELEAMGWTLDDGAAGQKHAVDYMAKEFIDSTALEGGDAEYQEWHANSASKYYNESVLTEIAQNPGQTKTILGNFGENKFMPNLIHDGVPREKTLNFEIGAAMLKPKYKGIQYSIKFEATYRVNDAEAAKFVGLHTGMSAESVLQSNYAKDVLKDGTGESIYKAMGYANVVVAKDVNGQMKIIGFESKADFDTTDFANPDAN